MSFISYAQNFEDVMLWRALKHVENGFYIDVGANDPTLYSVTRAFYDSGWHGINVEPVAQFFERLARERTRDLNLQFAVAAAPGVLTLYDLPDSGLATLDSSVAEMHRQSGWIINEVEIPVVPLADICQKYVACDIHFLKVDVEGAEKQVLLGMDFRLWRPWVVVVEATIPMSQKTVQEEWEFILLRADYQFVYFDGLNRFYIAAEHSELAHAFTLPPNVFDGFVLNIDQESKLRAVEAESRAHRSMLRVQETETQVHAAETRAQTSEAQTQAAETRVHAAEARVHAAEARVHAAETRAHAAETRAHAAETRAQTAEAQTHAAETRAQTAEAQTHAAETRAQTAEAQTHVAETRAQTAEAQTHVAETSIQTAEAQTHAAEFRAQAAELWTQALLNSVSWRITAPLRWMGTAALLAKRTLPVTVRNPLQAGQQVAEDLIHNAAQKVLARPALTKTVIKILDLSPRLKTRLQNLLDMAPPPPPSSQANMPDNLATGVLTERAEKILNDLRRAMAPDGKR